MNYMRSYVVGYKSDNQSPKVGVTQSHQSRCIFECDNSETLSWIATIARIQNKAMSNK